MDINLNHLTTQIRRDILRMVHQVNSGHPGGSLGCVEFFAVLYFKIMNIDLSNLSPLIFWPIRILSVFIFYQILLIIVAIPFGQFSYFLRVEKKMLSRFGLNLN